MRDIHPIRGLLWVVMALVLSSITAEGIVNHSIEDNRTSNRNLEQTISQNSFTNIQPKTCYQGTFLFTPTPATTSAQTKTSTSPFKVITGVINDNLYSSAVRVGLNPSLILDLADIFSSHIDFTTDLRKGDSFSVVLGNSPHPTNVKSRRWIILAAKVTVQGEVYEAFFFQPPGQKSSYYDSEGKSLTKAFLKAPLQYRRISSMFTKRRFHPILKIYRPHFGIDYAAPVDTPVSAIGAGKVVFVGKKGGFGNLVEIKHNGVYSSSYGHLSRFAQGLKVGQYVERGEVIGYVGKTGLATGPHLDFRFYANGRPVNFMTIADTIPMASIPRTLVKQFESISEFYRTLIAQEEAKKLAMKSQPK